MPTSPVDAEGFAEHIRKIYDDAEGVIFRKVSRRLRRGIDEEGWAEKKRAEILHMRLEIAKQIDRLQNSVLPSVKAMIVNAYKMGSDEAIVELSRLANKFGTQQVVNTDIHTNIHQRAVNVIAGRATGALEATHFRVLRSAEDIYKNVIAESTSMLATGTINRREAAQMTLNKFADRGITGFTDKAGRNWDLASYAEMAVRSSMGQAAVQGHINRLSENGHNLVIVSNSPEECEICRPWEGKILRIADIPKPGTGIGNISSSAPPPPPPPPPKPIRVDQVDTLLNSNMSTPDSLAGHISDFLNKKLGTNIQARTLVLHKDDDTFDAAYGRKDSRNQVNGFANWAGDVHLSPNVTLNIQSMLDVLTMFPIDDPAWGGKNYGNFTNNVLMSGFVRGFRVIFHELLHLQGRGQFSGYRYGYTGGWGVMLEEGINETSARHLMLQWMEEIGLMRRIDEAGIYKNILGKGDKASKMLKDSLLRQGSYEEYVDHLDIFLLEFFPKKQHADIVRKWRLNEGKHDVANQPSGSWSDEDTWLRQRGGHLHNMATEIAPDVFSFDADSMRIDGVIPYDKIRAIEKLQTTIKSEMIHYLKDPYNVGVDVLKDMIKDARKDLRREGLLP